MQAAREHDKPNPEWAFLRDRAGKRNVPDWKKMRARKAANAIKILNRITAE